ncbi:MAG: prolyl oligopeptidase family serine peptidase [Eubacteriales bacterium]
MKKITGLIVLVFASIVFMGCEENKMKENETEQPSFESVNYTTVTRGYDWGPAIDKLILDFDVPIDGSTLDIETFSVKSIRTYKESDFFGQEKSEATEKVAERIITKVYICDESGNEALEGEYVALEMEVSPTMVEASPYNYDFSSGLNEMVDTTYEISISEDSILKSVYGEDISFASTGKGEKAGDIKIVADDFINNQPFSYEGIDLHYAYFVPQEAAQKEGSMPLIIWLHGAGEGGRETSVALLGNKVVNLASDEIQSFFGEEGAYVLVPQAPTMWMDYDGSGTYNINVKDSQGHSYYTEALMALIDEFVSNNENIDKDRIYIGGCSNGGYMTVNMIINYPDYFAAAFPICEAYSAKWLNVEMIKDIVDMPIWLTHALTDSTVPITEGSISADYSSYKVKKDENGEPILKDEFSNALYDRLMEAGAENIHYSRFENVVDTTGIYKSPDGNPYEYNGHWSWIYVLNNECIEKIDNEDVSIFEWLSRQSK